MTNTANIKREHLTRTELQVLTDANMKHGAANFLHVEIVARFKALGLVEDRNEHMVKATPAGRTLWLGEGA